ncbi:MAG TPA: capsular biosynthesis protein [Morganella sp. (in: Bacteria)]|nr:capsular biosynthesis protein [Morganella sp. (in: enterobacteria)]
MKIIVTGAKGFIGKNLCTMLKECSEYTVLEIDRKTTKNEISKYLAEADFVYHLAGINRPQDDNEFEQGNTNLTDFICQELSKRNGPVPIMFSSSIQAEYNNPYGQSKAASEKIIVNYNKKSNSPYYIYRFPNVFGKWCKPNYNSFIATFCYNIINNIDIHIDNPDSSVSLVYIDDVCHQLISLLDTDNLNGLHSISPVYSTTVGEVADLLKHFRNSRDNLVIDNVGNGLIRALYSTYISYFSPSQFSYHIPSYQDDRGLFCEVLKTKNSGQFSFLTAHPGITRGGHYHHSKNEKFLVIQGTAHFKFKNIITNEFFDLHTDSGTLEIVDTIPGWSHDITNIGDNDLIVMLWANEIFDRDNPDTITCSL